MKCPKCGKETKVVKKDLSNNPENGRKYDRTLYKCDVCDVWVSVEDPESSNE